MYIRFPRQKTQALNDGWDGSMKPQKTNAVNPKPVNISATYCIKPSTFKAATEVGFSVWRPSRPPTSPTSHSLPPFLTASHLPRPLTRLHQA